VSAENVELVVGLFPAPDVDLAQLVRDENRWTAWTEANAPFLHPDFETVWPGLPNGKTYTGTGPVGSRDIWREWVAPWTTYRVETEDVIDLGERVLLLVHAFGRLEGSQGEVENTSASLWTVRDGKIARVEFYVDRTEALKAAGLEE
jgi:ketosteroid isomerase-like protein